MLRAGGACPGRVSVGPPASAGGTDRRAHLRSVLLGAQVSTGWLCQVQLEAADKLSGFITDLKGRLAGEAVLHAEETGTRVRTTKHWVHTICSGLLTLIAVHPKRGRKALEDIGVLGAYAGTLVHDGYASYDYLETAVHAQCSSGPPPQKRGPDRRLQTVESGDDRCAARLQDRIRGCRRHREQCRGPTLRPGHPTPLPRLPGQGVRRPAPRATTAAPPPRRMDHLPARRLEPGRAHA